MGDGVCGGVWWGVGDGVWWGVGDGVLWVMVCCGVCMISTIITSGSCDGCVCLVVVRMILGINVVVVFVVSSSNGALVVGCVWVLGDINGGGGGGAGS